MAEEKTTEKATELSKNVASIMEAVKKMTVMELAECDISVTSL